MLSPNALPPKTLPGKGTPLAVLTPDVTEVAGEPGYTVPDRLWPDTVGGPYMACTGVAPREGARSDVVDCLNGLLVNGCADTSWVSAVRRREDESERVESRRPTPTPMPSPSLRGVEVDEDELECRLCGRSKPGVVVRLPGV